MTEFAGPGRWIPDRNPPSPPAHRVPETDFERPMYPGSHHLDALLAGFLETPQRRPEPIPAHRRQEDFTSWQLAHADLPRMRCTIHTGLVHNGFGWVPQKCDCLLPPDMSALCRDLEAAPLDPKARRARQLLGGEVFLTPDDDLGLDDDDLYLIGDLGKALGRSSRQIRELEIRGIIPPADHFTAGEGKARKRAYTAQQIRGLRNIALQCGVINRPRKKISSTEFAMRAQELFQHLATRPRG